MHFWRWLRNGKLTLMYELTLKTLATGSRISPITELDLVVMATPGQRRKNVA
jgi:hypothetical protein